MLMPITLIVMVTIEKLLLLLLSIIGGGRFVYDVCTSVCEYHMAPNFRGRKFS